MDNELHGIITYDNIEVNGSNFGAMIVAKVDTVQYWRDRPLFLRYIDMWFSDAITWNSGDYKTYIDNDAILEYLQKLQDVTEGIAVYEQEAMRIQDSIRNYSHINDDTPEVNYPNPDEDLLNLELKDQDGNVVDTIQTDMGDREYKRTQNGLTAITILDALPSDYNDDTSATELDEVSIVTLPESFIKDKMWISQEYIPGLNQELADASSYIIDPLVSATDIPEYTQPDLLAVNSQLSGPQEVWYGIPLINLSPKDIPLKDSIIVHLNTKNGFKVDCTNISGTGLESSSIMIDKVIPPNTKFSVGVTIIHSSISLFLVVSGDSTIYRSSVPLNTIPEMTLTSFGVDNENRKSLCGTIYDIRHWDFEGDFNRNPDIIIPVVPRDAITYNNSNGLVRGTKTFSTREGEPGAENGGSWWNMSPQWKSVYNGYLDRFFCKDILNKTDFTLSWYQYQLGYPPGIRTFVSDSINNHYIKYDYSTFELIVEFKGVIQKTKITLPEFMWVQFNVRYSIERNQIVISFRETNQDKYYSYTFDIPENINFQLITLWARYSNDETSHVEKQKGAFTLLNIFTVFKTDDELLEFYHSHKKFLEPFDLKSIPREDLPL